MSDQSTPATGEVVATAAGTVEAPQTAPEAPVTPAASVETAVADAVAPVEAAVVDAAKPVEAAVSTVIDHAAVAAHTTWLVDAEVKLRSILTSILTRAEKSAIVAEVEKLAADLKL